MSKTPLMYVEPKEIEEGFEVERLPYAKGGEVIVPNAPVEPDERIDKMTGLPYNIQAGSAFVDEEDPEKRMLFNLGGGVSKALGTSEDPSMYRSDGSKKSAQGFLGPVKNNVEGGTMTEVSVGMEINGQEMEVPTMVPSLTKKEIETLANMQLEGNAKNIPESIIMKAKQHALQRIEQGLSPFYQDGEK
jgi:hypothetical protein